MRLLILVQIYYGTLIHQVLDRAHAHYAGLRDPETKGQFPTDQDIENYFNEVDQALRVRVCSICSRIYTSSRTGGSSKAVKTF